MRHTLTLEPDVDIALTEACKASGRPFKQVVNSLLREGLARREAAKTVPPFRVRPLKLNLRPEVSLVSISNLETLIEEGHLG